MKFKYTILYVENVAEALDLYERAFGLERKMLHESGAYGELRTGDTTLAFSAKSLMRELGKAPGQAVASSPVFEIAFETDDVPGGVERALAAGATLVQAPHDQPWGQTMAYVTDRDGTLVEICSPVRG